MDLWEVKWIRKLWLKKFVISRIVKKNYWVNTKSYGSVYSILNHLEIFIKHKAQTDSFKIPTRVNIFFYKGLLYVPCNSERKVYVTYLFYEIWYYLSHFLFQNISCFLCLLKKQPCKYVKVTKYYSITTDKTGDYFR